MAMSVAPTEKREAAIRAGKRLQKALREYTAALAELRHEDAELVAFSLGLEADDD